jgi:HK97 family phage major capsid protein
VDEDSINEQERTVELSVSSEFPVRRYYGYEILDHKKSSIRLDRLKDGAAVRKTHWGDQIGVVEKVIGIVDKKLRIKARFSEDNPEADIVFKDIVKKIRRNVSLYYDIYDVVFEEEKEGVSTVRVMDWEPIHISIEPDGADPTVGVGRSADSQPMIFPINADAPIEEQIENFNNKNERGIKILFTNNNTRSKKTMTPEELAAQQAAQEAAITAARTEGESRAAERIADIISVVDDFQKQVPGLNLREKAESFIKDPKKNGTDFYREVVKPGLKDPVALKTPDTQVGLSDKETRDYSITKVVLYQMGKVDSKDVGMELEASRALESKLGLKRNFKNSIFLPDEVMNRRRSIKVGNLTSAARDLLIGTPASGGLLVRDNYIAQSFIELLQNAMVFKLAGVEMLTGLKGEIPMNRELDNYAYYHVGEGSGPSKSSITFGQEKMVPKKAGALAKYSYEFLMQAELGLNETVEAYIERRLAVACALGADKDIYNGTGSNYQPKGIKNWTGVGGVVGANFNRARALQMEGQLFTANAQELGTMKFISRGTTRSILKDKKISEVGDLYLVKDDNKMIGYDYNLITNQVDAGDLLFGIWSQMIVGYWNQVEIAANPFGADEFAAGDVLVRALQALDVFVANPGAFSIAEGVN